MTSKLKVALLCWAIGLVLAATGLLVAEENHQSSPTDFLVWDSIAKATNVVFGATNAFFVFNFTNVTSSSVVITDVQTSCGCATAKTPKLPWTIVSGTNGQITVTMNLAGESSSSVFRTVDVITDKGTKVLTVKVGKLPTETQSVTNH